jgi:hypothetical protein
MTARTSLRWLAWLGAALTLFDLLSDLPATVGDVRVFRVRMLLGVLVLAAAVYFAAVRLIVRYAWPLGTGPLAATALAAANPRYHWYFACLALPVVVAPSRALLWLATAPLLLRFFWPSLVYVPAILLLPLADLRPWLAIEHRRGAEIGETPCPPRLP